MPSIMYKSHDHSRHRSSTNSTAWVGYEMCFVHVRNINGINQNLHFNHRMRFMCSQKKVLNPSTKEYRSIWFNHIRKTSRTYLNLTTGMSLKRIRLHLTHGVGNFLKLLAQMDIHSPKILITHLTFMWNMFF